MATNPGRWTAERANAWYAELPWQVGSNFIPSTASNQLEMWQAETFDPATIDRELAWAAGLGMNSMRVFLHDLLWLQDAPGFQARIDAFLRIASERGIRTLFVLFDDCWHGGAKLGPQPEPVPGRHNSRWLQSPGNDVVEDASAWPRLEAYVKGVVGAFADDERVLGWDLYNEVTNGFLPAQALPEGAREAVIARVMAHLERARPQHLRLLELAFAWARAVSPSQPLTAGAYTRDREMNTLLADLSDVISFHCYEGAEAMEGLIERLQRHGRPLLCTEYMSRPRSTFASDLPVLKRHRVAAYNWGFVNGRTQTHIAWVPQADSSLWFHDILRRDGSAYDEAEVALLRQLANGA